MKSRVQNKTKPCICTWITLATTEIIESLLRCQFLEIKKFLKNTRREDCSLRSCSMCLFVRSSYLPASNDSRDLGNSVLNFAVETSLEARTIETSNERARSAAFQKRSPSLPNRRLVKTRPRYMSSKRKHTYIDTAIGRWYVRYASSGEVCTMMEACVASQSV